MVNLSRKKSLPLEISINNDIMKKEAIDDLLKKARANPKNGRFKDLYHICDHYFGPPRQRGSSHRVYKTPWPGNPRVNIQNDKGMAKAYQVRQVLMAIEKLGEKNEPEF